MSIFNNAKQAQRRPTSDDAVAPAASGSASIVATRQNEVTVDGATFDLEQPDTKQAGDDNWLASRSKHGRPRGRDAIQARQVSQTAAMEAITNGIVDQIVGGELAFESDEGDISGPQADFRDVLRDVLEGPHPMGNDLDDLLTAAVADMVGPGNAYWQLLPTEDGRLPVGALIPLDALTIRHNTNHHGFVPEDEPAYWQARGAFGESGMAAMGAIDPVPLDDADLAVMHYPRGARSYQAYPKSPSLQVLEWLEILTNSTTHHNRFYNDSELPPGFIQVLNASNRTVEDVKDKLQAAKGDPRSVEVIGGEGQAMWVEMGGTAVNLDVIQEQQWFYELCLGSLGLGKAEVGLIEDVNRANGEIESSRIFKRIAGPFSKQFESAFKHVASQFDFYDNQFSPKLRFTDPREERAREERLRKMFQAGGLTYRQYVRRRGDTEVAERDFTVDINGRTIDYGDDPLWVAKEKIAEARTDEDVRPMDEDAPADDDANAARYQRQTYEVNGETLDLTPPDYMVAAAEAGQDAKDEFDLGDCGTGVGDRRAEQLIDDETGPEVWDEIAAYLTSHCEDVESLDGDYTDWGEAEWTDGCGTVQYALWGGTGDGRGRDRAQEFANEIARAKGEDEPY